MVNGWLPSFVRIEHPAGWGGGVIRDMPAIMPGRDLLP
jgi:hypothetical protein